MTKHYLQRDVIGSHVVLYESIDGRLSLDAKAVRDEVTGRMKMYSLPIKQDTRGRYIEVAEDETKIASPIRPKVHHVAE